MGETAGLSEKGRREEGEVKTTSVTCHQDEREEVKKEERREKREERR